MRSAGSFCRDSASTDGRRRWLQRHLPALGRLHRVGGAEDEQVRHGAQGGQVLDRLVRRAVLAQADGIVRHHVDDAHAHQRDEADRRPAVIGEDEERAAIGDHPAVQRHAVHGRGHAVLAHAVVDVVAGEVCRCLKGSCSLARCCWSR